MSAEAEIQPEDAAAGEGEDGAKSGGKKKLIIIGAGALVLLLVLGGAGWFFFLRGGDTPVEASAPPSYFYDLPPMTVNLNSDKDEYLKLSISLELSDESEVKLIEPRMARVIDAFQVYLRELRRSDLEGSAGIYRLKEELRRRVNLAIYPAEVKSILFREILVQ